MMAREDRAWLAGLLDGEGCIDAPRGNPRLRVKMADLDVVLRAADLMGCTVYTEVDHRTSVLGKPYSPMHVAQISGEKAVEVLTAVLPWLGARRTAKATQVIAHHMARKSGRIRLLRTEAA